MHRQGGNRLPDLIYDILNIPVRLRTLLGKLLNLVGNDSEAFSGFPYAGRLYAGVDGNNTLPLLQVLKAGRAVCDCLNEAVCLFDALVQRCHGLLRPVLVVAGVDVIVQRHSEEPGGSVNDFLRTDIDLVEGVYVFVRIDLELRSRPAEFFLIGIFRQDLAADDCTYLLPVDDEVLCKINKPGVAGVDSLARPVALLVSLPQNRAYT